MLPVAFIRGLQNCIIHPQMAKLVCKPDKGKKSGASEEHQQGRTGDFGRGEAHLLGGQGGCLPEAARLQAPQQQLSASHSQLQQQLLQHLSRVAMLLQLYLSAAAAAVALSASSLHPAAVVALLLQPVTASISLLRPQHITLHLLCCTVGRTMQYASTLD